MRRFESRFFTVNIRGKDYRMYYHDECDVGKESIGTIVFLHGVNNQCADFDILAISLLSQRYRIIKPDILGRGKSDWLDLSADYNIEIYTENIICFLESLGVSNAIIFGTSMGGFISILLASKTGSKFIKKIILNDIGPYVEPKKQLLIARLLDKQHEFSSFEEIKNQLVKMFSLVGIGAEENWKIFFRNQIRLKADKKYHMHYDPKIFDLFVKEANEMKGINLWDQWKLIPEMIQIAVIRGKLSPLLTNKIISDMKDIRNDIQILTIEGVGHAPIFYKKEHIDQLCTLL